MALYRRSGGFGRTFGTQPSASTASTPSLSDLMKSTTAQTAEAKQANVQRQKEVTGIYDKVAGLFAPGGSFGQGYLEQINRQKVQDVSGAEQSDISRGLFGLRNRGQEWESQVGAPARLKLEDLRTQSYASALTGKAGFLERIENPYPDLSPLFQAAIAQSSVPQSYSTMINSYPGFKYL